MADNYYDEVEIEDMTFEEEDDMFYFPCPCGDMFAIEAEKLRNGSSEVAVCPSCSLKILIIYDEDKLPPKMDEVALVKLEEQAPMAVAIAA